MSGRNYVQFLGRWSLQGAGVLCVFAGVLAFPAVGEEREQRRSEAVDSAESLRGLEGVVNGELTDMARALRSLDQSYTYRGMRGCGSATAGSVHIDWDAKGVPEEKRYRVLPPEPLVLSRSSKGCGVHKQPCHEPAPPQVDRAPQQPCPCHGRQPDCPCQTARSACPCEAAHATPPCGHSRPDCGCATTTPDHPAIPLLPMTTTREETHRQPAVFPAPIYRHGAAGYSTGAYGCSGKSPPGAVLLNGRWTEASTGNGAGYAAPGPYGAVIAPQGSGSRVW